MDDESGAAARITKPELSYYLHKHCLKPPIVEHHPIPPTFMNTALTRTRLIGRHIQAPLRSQNPSIFTANMSVRHYTSPTFAESRTRI